MIDLLTVKIFLQVADDGSFSATARRRNMSVSSIARQVSGLEDRLGVRLLNRTTRHQSLTEIGHVYYDKMKKLISEFESANEVVASYRGEVRGTLNVHLRSSIARIIIPELGRFLDAHPDVKLNLTFTEQRTDLVANGVDLAVWLGALEDSSYIARRLTFTERVLVASPAYLEKAPPIREPKDLEQHNCLVFDGAQYSRDVWRLTGADQAVEVPVAGNLRTQSGWVLYDLVTNGLGVALAQKWMVAHALEAGSLQRVLPDYDANPVGLDVPLYVVYPHSHGLPPKTRAFVDFLIELFREHNVEEPASEPAPDEGSDASDSIAA